MSFSLSAQVHPNEDSISHIIYLIGNIGNDKKEENFLALNGMINQLKADNDSTTVLILGNIFHNRFFPEGTNHIEQSLDSIKLIEILKNISKYSNNVFINPGKFEWALSKHRGYQCAVTYEYLVEKYIYEGNTFLPDKGCPGPEEIEIGNNTVILFIDTQWWMNRELKNVDWQNLDCGMESENDLLIMLNDAINRHEGKHIIIAGHHPILSFGKHNGYFPGYTHVSPPLLGSAYYLYRNAVGNMDDFANPTYNSLINGLKTIFNGNQDIVYVSSHESSLQYINEDNIFQIISGTGSETNYVKKTDKAFTASVSGYMRLVIYENNEVWLEAWEIKEDNWRIKIFESHLYTLEPAKYLQPDYDIRKLEGQTVPVQASTSYGIPKKHAGLMGNNYRAEWVQVVRNIPYFDMGSEHGGLEVVQRGGGMQTKSLRLENKNGNQFVLRSIEKYPEAAVPEELKKTIAKDLVKDFISSSHPYAAIVIPSLADAIGVYHTNPEVVYLPDEPLLRNYEEEFGGNLYLFEERPMKKNRKLISFGNSDDIISTTKLINKRLDNNEVKVDQIFTLKSRLFDMWIGDWDRHEDQWRWAEFKQKEKHKFYRPIPRDRDQAFFFNDGLLIKVGTRQPGLSKFQGFDFKIRDINGLNYNGRYFDRSFLTEPSWEDWESSVSYLKENFTDEVIENAIHNFPEGIYKHSGDVIVEKLKKRRDDLEVYAKKYYDFLSKEVTIVGSDEKEWFNIERFSDDETKVTVWDLVQKTGELHTKMYERTFDNDITSEINLFGLGDDDLFTIKGDVHNGIKLRVIGGFGYDQINDSSHVKGLMKNTIVYDTKTGIKINGTSETKNKTSNKVGINYYDRTAFKYDFFTPLVYIDTSPDDGLFISADIKINKFGFRKNPYKWRQKYSLRFSPTANSWKFLYEGDYIDVIGNWDINVEAHMYYPHFTDYYYGLGNETSFDEESREEEYYHFNFSSIEVIPLVRYDFNNQKHSFEIGPYINFYRLNSSEDEERKFLDDFPGADNNQMITYAGIFAGYTIDTRNSDHFPLYGLYWKSTFSPIIDTSNDSIFFTKLTSAFSFYQSTGGSLNTTLAARIGGALNFGNYPFYQANDLGGKNNLRGYRRMRFSGDHNIYVNLEARIRLFRFSMPLFPGSFGVYGFFDTGRVWYKNQDGIDPTAASGKSTIWHAGYGGGIWIAPLRRYVFSVDISNSTTDDQILIYMRYGFFF